MDLGKLAGGREIVAEYEDKLEKVHQKRLEREAREAEERRQAFEAAVLREPAELIGKLLFTRFTEDHTGRRNPTHTRVDPSEGGNKEFSFYERFKLNPSEERAGMPALNQALIVQGTYTMEGFLPPAGVIARRALEAGCYLRLAVKAQDETEIHINIGPIDSEFGQTPSPVSPEKLVVLQTAVREAAELAGIPVLELPDAV